MATERNASANTVIGTKADVAAWLADNCYCARGKSEPVKKSKVYADARSGKLPVADPKGITIQEVESYITRAGLIKRGDGRNRGELDALNADKLRLENRKLKAATELKELELGVQRRKFVERSVVRRELAGKYGVLEAILKNYGRTFIGDLIAQVGGNPAKAATGVALWNGAVDGALDEIGHFKEVEIIIAKREKE